MTTKMKMKTNRGLSLVEVLIVVAIIGMLLQLALPAVQAAREAGRRTQCASNIRQLGLALHNIHAAHKKLPQAAGYWPMETGPFRPDKPEDPLYDPSDPANPESILSKSPPANFSSAMYFLLPYMEEEPKYKQFWGTTQGNRDLPVPPFDRDGQWSERGRAPAVQLCPSDPASKFKGLTTVEGNPLGISNYPVNIQALGHYSAQQPTSERKRRLPQDFPDGASKTVVFAERYAICRRKEEGRNAWLGTRVYVGDAPCDPFFAVNDTDGTPNVVRPQDAPKMEDCDPTRLQSSHPGVMNVVFADGSTRPINANINLKAWTYLVLPDDGKTFDGDW